MKNHRDYGANRLVYEALNRTPRDVMEKALAKKIGKPGEVGGQSLLTMPLLEQALHDATWAERSTHVPYRATTVPLSDGQKAYETTDIGGIRNHVDLAILDADHPCWVSFTNEPYPRLKAQQTYYGVPWEQESVIILGRRPGIQSLDQVIDFCPGGPVEDTAIWDAHDICEPDPHGHRTAIDRSGGRWDLETVMTAQRVRQKLETYHKLMKTHPRVSNFAKLSTASPDLWGD